MAPVDLVSFGELPTLLGVGRTTAWRYADRPDFPKPYAELNTGRVWKRRDVEAWKRRHLAAPPKLGRPAKK